MPRATKWSKVSRLPSSGLPFSMPRASATTPEPRRRSTSSGAGGDGELRRMFRREGLDQVDEFVGDLPRLAGVRGAGWGEDGHECDVKPALPRPGVVEFPFRNGAGKIGARIPIQSIGGIDVGVDDEMALRQRPGALCRIGSLDRIGAPCRIGTLDRLGTLCRLARTAHENGDGNGCRESPLHA